MVLGIEPRASHTIRRDVLLLSCVSDPMSPVMVLQPQASEFFQLTSYLPASVQSELRKLPSKEHSHTLVSFVVSPAYARHPVPTIHSVLKLEGVHQKEPGMDRQRLALRARVDSG